MADGGFDWLLGARSLHFGEPGVRFAFAMELAPWEWASVAVACAIAAWWCYRKLEGPNWARATLGVVRTLTLLLLVFLACGPKLTRPNETVERDWVLFLVDRSSSLRIADAEVDGTRTGRDAQLRSFLARSAPSLQRLASEKNVTWLGFDSGTYELRAPQAGSSVSSPVVLDAPVGRRSDLGAAVEAGLARLAARPISGIVVFSDGRSSDQLPRPLLRRLAAERIPVMTVALGSSEPLSDIAVRSAQGPGVAFVNDNVPIEVELERTGALGKPARTAVELVDTLTGAVLLRRDADWPAAAPGEADQRQRLTLAGTGAAAGNSRWVVRLVTETPDLVPDNNEQAVSIDLVDRPLHVLYLDGYPRWEYRYIKNLLSREKSVQFAAMLLASGRRYLTEGSLAIDSLPNSPAEWERFDVLVMGDVRPEVFTPEQLAQIKQRVAVGGAGLIWIGGESATPTAWRGTPLADLLPIALGPSDTIRPWDTDVTLAPTPLADRLGVMRLTQLPQEDGSFWPKFVSDPALGWTRLRWVQRIDPSQLKPAAEALAIARPTDASPTALPTPAVITMRFGAGRSLYVATDEIWRWRYGRGEDLPEKFWLQMVRLLGRESVARSGRPAILEVAPARSEVAKPVRITLELQDQALLDAAPASVNVRITKIGETGAEAASPTPAAGGAELTLRPALGEAGGRRNFVGVWIPQATGRYRVTATDALLTSANLSTEAEVWLADDELRRPETDHALLAQISRETGGTALRGEELAKLDRLLPKREIRVALAPDEQTLWDAPASLLLLLVLLTMEWVGRRLIRLA